MKHHLPPMPCTTIRLWIVLLLATPYLIATSVHARADEHVVVRLTDGRVVQGVVDERSSESTLWLRTTGPLLLMQSGFGWDRIATVEHDGKILSVEDFRPRVGELKTPVDTELLDALQALPEPIPADAVPAAAFDAPERAPRVPPAVRSLTIYASPANWDADAELDGIEVQLLPLDDRGDVVPVDGQVDFRMVGEATEILSRPWFPDLGRWTVRVRADEFDRSGAVVRLPFRGFDPQLRYDVGPYAIVSARLKVAGRGAFDANDDSVRLLPTSWMRDRMQQKLGTRLNGAR